MYAITSNPVDVILAAVILAVVALGLLGLILDNNNTQPLRPCRCLFCRDLRANKTRR